MKIDIKDVIDIVDLPDGFVMFQNDKGYFLALKSKTAGVVAAHEIDKPAFDCIKRREARKG